MIGNTPTNGQENDNGEMESLIQSTYLLYRRNTFLNGPENNLKNDLIIIIFQLYLFHKKFKKIFIKLIKINNKINMFVIKIPLFDI